MKENRAEPVRGEILLPEEVAKRLRVSLKTVYTMATKGELPTRHVRSMLRFDSMDVDDYLFFSKFHSGYLKLSEVDKKQIIERLEEQIHHTKNYLEMFFKKPKNKGVSMRV